MYNRIIHIDKRLLLPSLIQLFALATPFVYLRAAMLHGTEATMLGEALLSIIGFSVVLVDFSSTTFLARNQDWLIRKGALASIVAGRVMIAATISVPIFLVVYLFDGDWKLSTYLALSGMLLGSVLDPSWIYVGKGYLWFPSALGTMRFGIATILTLNGSPPVIALSISYLSSSIIAVLFSGIRNDHIKVIRLSIVKRIARQNYKPTLTEGLTAIFSRLDIAIATALLPVEQALIYAVSRKLTMGLLSIAYSGARIFYLERNEKEISKLKSSLKLLGILAAIIGLPLSILMARFWFDLTIDLDLVATITLFTTLIFLGNKKIVIQFSHLYAKKHLSADFFFTLVSVIIFFAAIALLTSQSFTNATYFAAARLLPDIIYIMSYILSKKYL